MILLYLVLLGFLIYALMRWRLYRLERDKQQLEKLVQERTQQVVRLEKMATVGKLTQGLIDRILNPLNYINNFAKLSQGLVKDVTANIEDEKEHMDTENYEDTLDVLSMLDGNLQKVGEHGANTTRTLKAMEEMLKDHSGGIVSMDLKALLKQTEETFRHFYEKDLASGPIKVVFSIPTSEVRIMGNAEHLGKAIMSILGNAVYAINKRIARDHTEGEIRVLLTTDEQYAVIRLRDNGIGIEETIINKVFDPFFTTKTTGEASGVGLYLSREIVQNHGGDITVQSEKNVYTELTITIPLER
jgi:signal transduction histidine kinase